MAKSKSKANVKTINNPAVSETYENAVSQNAQTAGDAGRKKSSGTVDVKPPLVRCYVPVLDDILAKLPLVDWRQIKSSFKEIENTYVMEVIRQIIHTMDAENAPLVNHSAAMHYFNGTHYEQIDETKLMCFLIEAARQCGVSDERALFQSFANKMIKQVFINSAWYNGGISAPDTPFINLRNGTLFFDEDKYRFERQHSPQHLIRYCLGFDYVPKATATEWQKHLDRALPDKKMQAYLAECLALPFYFGKIEKALILYGRRNTGKSTTLDVYRALLGSQNCSAVTLAALTRSTDTGDYKRSHLDGKLVNIASDISSAIGDEGLMKTLISREMITVRNIGKRPFDMVNYARLVFATNELSPKLFADLALTKRVAIIGFDQRIKSKDIKTDFIEQIIANELPGVLNWILAGLDRLRKTGRLDPPASCVAAMERMRVEMDWMASWLDDRRYQLGDSNTVPVKAVYPDFAEFCKEGGCRGAEILTKFKFTEQLRELGYSVKSPNGHAGTLLYFSKPNP